MVIPQENLEWGPALGLHRYNPEVCSPLCSCSGAPAARRARSWTAAQEPRKTGPILNRCTGDYSMNCAVQYAVVVSSWNMGWIQDFVTGALNWWVQKAGQAKVLRSMLPWKILKSGMLEIPFPGLSRWIGAKKGVRPNSSTPPPPPPLFPAPRSTTGNLPVLSAWLSLLSGSQWRTQRGPQH